MTLSRKGAFALGVVSVLALAAGALAFVVDTYRLTAGLK